MDPNKYTSALVGYDFGFRGRPLAASLATPHGTAAALKAEAPQRAQVLDGKSVWFMPDGRTLRLSAKGSKRMRQRIARKAANRRKARRGWR